MTLAVLLQICTLLLEPRLDVVLHFRQTNLPLHSPTSLLCDVELRGPAVVMFKPLTRHTCRIPALLHAPERRAYLGPGREFFS